MCGVVSWGLPFYPKTDEQTRFSFGLRITAVALGIIFATVGILVVCGIPALSQIGTTVGGTLITIGALFACAAALVKCKQSPKKQHTHIADAPPPTTGNPAEFPSKKEEAILYMSISGNPPHLGHLAAVGTAIKELKKRNFEVLEGFVSLSPQSYLDNKAKRTASKVYSFVQRQEMLSKTIALANKNAMFDGVPIKFWNDQEKGYSDHPDSYEKLKSNYVSKKVFLVAGSDLCYRMHNWPELAHAIIVTRGEGDLDIIVTKNLDKEITQLSLPNQGPFVTADGDSRILVTNAFPEYESYSSTKIREGKIEVDYLPDC